MGTIKNYFPVLTRIKFTQFYEVRKHFLTAMLAQQTEQYPSFTDNLHHKTAQLSRRRYTTGIQILFPEVRLIISADFLVLFSAMSLKDTSQKWKYNNH